MGSKLNINNVNLSVATYGSESYTITQSPKTTVGFELKCFRENAYNTVNKEEGKYCILQNLNIKKNSSAILKLTFIQKEQ